MIDSCIFQHNCDISWQLVFIDGGSQSAWWVLKVPLHDKIDDGGRVEGKKSLQYLVACKYLIIFTSGSMKSNSLAQVYNIVWKFLKSPNLLLNISPMCA